MTTNLGDLTVSINGLMLNVKNDDGSRLSLESFAGWGSPHTNVEAVNNSNSDGGWAGESFNGPRSLSLGGNVHGASIESLSVKVDALIGAFAKSDVPLIVNEGGVARHMMVRRDGAVLTQWLSPRIAKWSAQVIALDPRKYGATVSGSTGLPSTVGGMTFPFTFNPDFTFSETVSSGRVALTNPGNIEGPVRLRITAGVGGLTGPKVTHIASGRVLEFATTLTIPAGNWIDVDMRAQTVLENGTAARNGWVTGRGWSWFEPGANEWAFTAQSGVGTLLVEADPAWQ